MMKYFTIFLAFSSLVIFSCKEDDNASDPISTCDEIAIEDNDLYNSTTDDLYVITEINLTDNCLEITFGSSGCDSDLWIENLYDSGNIMESSPIQRSIKMELVNDQECLAFFTKTVSFDLVPLQVDNESEIIFYLEGWEDPIQYVY